jgi:hypothetical protein
MSRLPQTFFPEWTWAGESLVGGRPWSIMGADSELPAYTKNMLDGKTSAWTVSNSLTRASNHHRACLDDSQADILGFGADGALCFAVCRLLFPYVR